MARKGHLHRFRIELSDVDRGVYETLDLRVSRHPSESGRFLVMRTLAYALLHAPGIAFSKGGVSEGDAPPLCIADGEGRIVTWVEVGVPGRERLRRAIQRAASVCLFVEGDAARALETIRGFDLARAERVGVVAVETALVDALEAALDRTENWTLVCSDGVLHVGAGERNLVSSLTRLP